MLETLSKNLSSLMRKLITGISIDKKRIEEMLEELKRILIQADVDIELIENLIKRIRKRCFEEKVAPGLTLREHTIKVVYEELVNLLGGEPSKVLGKKKIMFVGLFGSGKTSSIGKLARYLQKRGLKPALVCLDYHRAAAAQQLKELGEKINVPVYIEESNDPFLAAKNSIEKLKRYDVLIFDTAGRNALDKELAEELKKLVEIIKPDEVLLTIPAELGKVAKVQSEEFNKLVGITGVFVTRLDGTAKGGGALTACASTGAKIKFIGIGERLEDLEVYSPKRFISRLLGLGDLQTLLEKAKEAEIKPEKVEKIVEGKFTLEDFYEQIKGLQKMGSVKQILKLIPGFGMLNIPDELLEMQQEKMKVFKYIIDSMTPEERRNPEIIDTSRIKRIAKGSGRKEEEVRELLQQYNKMKKMLRMIGGKAGLKRGAFEKILKRFGFKF